MTNIVPVTLPTSPVALEATLSLVSKSTEMSGPLGGPTQRVLRVGSRFKADFQFPPMPYAIGRQWLARLITAEATPVAIRFPQRGLSPAYVGALVVDGASAVPNANTGGVLAVRGGTPNIGVLSGQFFHVLSSTDGRRYLHMVRDDMALAATGKAGLNIVPPLRFTPVDGDLIEVVAPMIEGFVSMSWSWTIELVRRVGLKFTVIEDR